MRTRWFPLFCALLVTAGFALFLTVSTIEAVPAFTEKEMSALRKISGVSCRQVGDTTLVIDLKGDAINAPELQSSTPSAMVFRIPGARVASLVWKKEMDFPLAKQIVLSQDKEALVMTINVMQSMKILEVRGTAPANQFIMTLVTADQAARLAGQEQLAVKPVPKVDTGDPFTKTMPITLDLRDVELRDVFRLFGKYIGMNVISDPSVPNSLVTMSLNQVPLNQAFSYIMKMYDVTYAIMGKTIIVGTADSIAKVVGREGTRSYHIAYADLKQLGGILQGLTGVTKVIADDRLKTLYVTGRIDQLDEVDSLLQRLDHPGRQVMLQARIVEISDTATKDFETMLDAVYNHWWMSYSKGGLNIGSSYVNTNDAYTAVEDRPGTLVTDMKNVAAGTLKLLDAGIVALVNNNKGKVIADPSVITLDGQKATIKLTENYPYVSQRDQAGNPTWSEKEVGPKLEFLPTIGRDGIVTVKLKISTGEIIGTYVGANKEEFPQTTNREVDTMVRVRDGEPFVVGGLFKDQKTKEVSKIPVLSDIPLLGQFFTARTSKNIKSELAMIVVPYILHTPDTSIEKTILK